MKIVITENISKRAEEILRAADPSWQIVNLVGTKTPVTEAIADADAMLIRTATRVTPELLDGARQLRVIGRAGVGVDNIDDDQRAAIVEVEQAKLGGGEVPESPLAGQPPVVEPCRGHALHRVEGVACCGGHVLGELLERVQRSWFPRERAGLAAHVSGCGGPGCAARSGRAQWPGRRA